MQIGIAKYNIKLVSKKEYENVIGITIYVCNNKKNIYFPKNMLKNNKGIIKNLNMCDTIKNI